MWVCGERRSKHLLLGRLSTVFDRTLKGLNQLCFLLSLSLLHLSKSFLPSNYCINWCTKMPSNNADIADYIIVGGGTSGLVVANRLSENPEVSVLVLEAGENHLDDPRVNVPALWTSLIGTELDWRFASVSQVRAESSCVVVILTTNFLRLIARSWQPCAQFASRKTPWRVKWIEWTNSCRTIKSRYRCLG